MFITYVYELVGADADHILANAYRKNIDSKKIDEQVQDLFPIFPSDYPESIKRLIRQAIINLSYYVESEDYSQYVFPAFRALEGHMKYLFVKAGITICSKKGFNCFNRDPLTGEYVLSDTIISDRELKSRLEKYYNFYNTTRHTIFHFGDIIGNTDSTRLIETKGEADELIKKCLTYICEE